MLVNSLRSPSEFIEESKWIHWGIRVNTLRNLSEFIEEFEWIHWGILGNCWFQLNLFNSNETVELKEYYNDWLLARRPISLVLVTHYGQIHVIVITLR